MRPKYICFCLSDLITWTQLFGPFRKLDSIVWPTPMSRKENLYNNMQNVWPGIYNILINSNVMIPNRRPIIQSCFLISAELLSVNLSIRLPVGWFICLFSKKDESTVVSIIYTCNPEIYWFWWQWTSVIKKSDFTLV